MYYYLELRRALARRHCAHAHKDKDHHRGHSRSSHGLMAQSDEYRGWSRHDLRAARYALT